METSDVKQSKSKGSNTREEGELSSSSDAENRVSSATQSAGSVNPPVPSGSILLPSSNNFTKEIQSWKAHSGLNPTTSVVLQSQTSVQLNNKKSLEKQRVPLKSANSSWHAPSGNNSNLVISFSDDDSGSDSEDHQSGKALLEIKQNRVLVDGNQRVSSLLSEKSSKLQPTARNVNKVLPKNLSVNRTFVSSTPKVNGGILSRVGKSSAVDLGTRVRNLSMMKRNSASQESGFDQGATSNNSKLQDLRQQIALRERELKLKAAQQNKESVSVVDRDYMAMNLGADAARKSNPISKVGGKLEVTEPNRKRIRVSGSYSTPKASEVHQETLAVKPSISLREEASECSSLQDMDTTNHSQKGSPTRTESTVKWKKQDDTRVNISSENPPHGLRGANINNNHIQTDKITLQIGEHQPLVSFSKTSTSEKHLLNDCVNPQGISKQRTTAPPLEKVCQNVVELNHPTKIGEHQPLVSFSKTSTSEKHLLNDCENPEGISKQRAADPPLENVCREPLNNFSLPNYFGSLHDSENNNIDMHSLVEMEESVDKELEEAQDQRRICEIEERNALKAYRKAQRALVEANAKCTELYHKRELYSAHFRSFIFNDSSLLWSMRKQHAGIGNNVDKVSKNLELLPSSSHPKGPEYNGHNELGYDLNIQRANDPPLAVPYRHVDGQKMGSEQCSEPDASTSEPMRHCSKGAANIANSPSNDLNNSADEVEETSPLDRTTLVPNYKIRQAEPNSMERQKDIQNHSNNKLSTDGSIDSLVLEATLRSELFARLGKRALSKNSGSTNLVPVNVLAPENDNVSERTPTSNGSVPLSEAEKSLEFDIGGNDQSERELCGDPVQIQSNNIQNNVCSAKGHQSTAGVFSSASVLRSAFGHVKAFSPYTPLVFQSRKRRIGTFDHGTGPKDSGERGSLTASTIEASVNNIYSEEIGSFTRDLAVDPFWPLCMYELRGKCNNDQCPWQHVRDFSNDNVGQHPLDNSDNADFQVELTVNKTKCKSFHNCESVAIPPTYLVGVDILRADPRTSASLVTWKNGQCWQKCFSICLALSNLLQKDVPPEELFLHGNDGRIEVAGNWDKHFSYFQSRNSTVNHLNQMLPTNMQALEMAFFMLCQEVSQLDGTKKALSVLSRAIEADPKSEVLWMTYLLIYYGNVKSVAKDDMFSYAVKNYDRSYGLWLMYVNSRLNLEDRLVAYDAALTALCHHSPASEGDKMYVSACILDLFLQMMDCLCMSGNIEKAIQKINGFLHEATNSDQNHSLLLSDILACLTISDKCMFWVCCVYLVIYRKLPEAVVHKFECDKELLAIEWPRVNILDEEKQMTVKLLEMAVDSVNVSVNSESLRCQTNLRAVQIFGLCHIGCTMALDGLEYCRDLLDEYMKLCPSCVEFAVISARVQMNYYEGLSPEGFEEVLRNWPKETPGIHCIWNQYIECALQKGYPDFAKELIARWYDSFPEFRYPEKEKSDAVGTCSSNGPLEMASASNSDYLAHNSNLMDKIFGYLNLSLAELLHNNHIEALNAIDRAYKVAAPPFFEHCLKEHAKFLLTYDSQLRDSFFSEQLNVLKEYLTDALTFPFPEPLPRQFISKIEKPRVQQLISNILSPVPADFSVVNLVLEVWYGPSLVPQKFSETKELVDFVEAILEILPSNYKLAISVCNQLIKGENSIDVTSGSSMLYWASSTLVNTLFHAIPIAPEYVWVDAANILNCMAGIESISERFHKRALTVYPFSIKLWNCYYSLSKMRGDATSVVEAAREKGITITVG
ncbi:uncharacterized protein [Euphorbia lathyris]|uniref:uncharacterized protein isoform X2 n=1 Tax=Euphorbia lathyris TaxID=212925 RepID=UPI00331414C1